MENCEFCGKEIERTKDTETKEGHIFCCYACMAANYGDEIPEDEDFICTGR